MPEPTILAIANLGRRVHLVLDGQTVCRREPVDDRDVYDQDAGLRAWAGADQCELCLRRLRAARSRG